MQVKPVYLTAEGKTKLEAELVYLRSVKRQEVAQRIRTALEFTDAAGTPEYQEAKDEMAFVDGRIRALEAMLANAVMIEANHLGHDLVHIGSEVTVLTEDGDEERYVIVGKAEANPRQGKISNESPMGRALLGHKPGDDVEVDAPGGPQRFRIVRTA